MFFFIFVFIKRRPVSVLVSNFLAQSNEKGNRQFFLNFAQCSSTDQTRKLFALKLLRFNTSGPGRA
jgi:hypothetical protein